MNFSVVFFLLCWSSFAQEVSLQEKWLNFFPNQIMDTLQLEDVFSEKNFRSSSKTLFSRISSPLRSIRKDGGFQKLLQDEFTSVRLIPNLFLHGFGGGFDFRDLYEDLKKSQVPYPKAVSFFLLYSGNILNEIYESSNAENISSHDNITDLLFFDLLGKFLFLDDRIYKTAKDDFQMRRWTGQYAYSFEKNKISYAQLNYLINVPVSGSFEFFQHLGIKFLSGFSYNTPRKGYKISLAGGPIFDNPFDISKWRASTGLFLEKEKKQIASVIYNDTNLTKIGLNLFPLPFLSSIGFFIKERLSGELEMGISYVLGPGIYF